MSRKWAACRCFYKRNFYVKEIDEHLVYTGDEAFIKEYAEKFSKTQAEGLLQQVKSEMTRRQQRFKEFAENRKHILSKYKPSTKFTNVEPTINISNYKEVFQHIYRVPVISPDTCDIILKEIGKSS